MISIKHIGMAEAVRRLYNDARPQGAGLLHYDPKSMTLAEAEAIVGDRESIFIDYLKGRVMKIHIENDEFSPTLYDRDNGTGAAWKAIHEEAGV